MPEGDALLKIGWFHQNGLGGLRADGVEATRWYRRAAAEGSARQAMVNLGISAHEGNGGVRRDKAEMLRWFRKAAEAGSGEASAMLSCFYTEGLPSETPGAPPLVAPDPELAAQWMQQAGESGYQPSGCQFQ